MKRLLVSAKTEPTIKLEQKNSLYPLYRSKTQDNQYNNKNNSPITQFVCNLLGLPTPSTKQRSRHHKSLSTTSITKSSVISSYQHTTLSACTSAEIVGAVKKPSAITIVTPPNILSASVKGWDQQQQPEEDTSDDHSSVSSNILESSIVLSDSSSISSVNSSPKCYSAAMDALVNASLIPSKKVVSNEFDDMPPITLLNRRDDTEPVITVKIAEMIRPYIPRRHRIAQKWSLVYSLDQHGISLATCYSLMRNYEGPCILIIKDDKKQVFGAYLSNSLSSQTHYYGTGECFLWKMSYNHPNENKAVPKVKAFPWTGKNDYMILSDNHFIAIGGGNGKFGLWLDSDLHQGYTATCPTFDNECLSMKSEFQCMEMEIWSLGL